VIVSSKGNDDLNFAYIADVVDIGRGGQRGSHRIDDAKDSGRTITELSHASSSSRETQSHWPFAPGVDKQQAELNGDSGWQGRTWDCRYISGFPV